MANIPELILAPLAAGALAAGLLFSLLVYRRHLPLDHPNDRSLHTQPTPRVGGLAVIPAILVCAGVFLGGFPLSVGVAIFLAGISFLDDRFGLPAGVRFFSHVLAAGAVLKGATGGMPLTIFLLLAVVWGTNLFNFMDGSDGLAGGMALFGFSFYGLAAVRGGAGELALLCFIVAGASGGFLFFNVHPARVFLGDAGSIPLGFLAGALGVEGWRRGLWPLGFPVLVFAPFAADATVTLLRRMVKREPFWRAHRSHYYQRLIQMGWGHARTARVEYVLMALSGGLALGLLLFPLTGRLIIWFSAIVVASGLMWTVDRGWSRYLQKGE